MLTFIPTASPLPPINDAELAGRTPGDHLAQWPEPGARSTSLRDHSLKLSEPACHFGFIEEVPAISNRLNSKPQHEDCSGLDAEPQQNTREQSKQRGRYSEP